MIPNRSWREVDREPDAPVRGEVINTGPIYRLIASVDEYGGRDWCSLQVVYWASDHGGWTHRALVRLPREHIGQLIDALQRLTW